MRTLTRADKDAIRNRPCGRCHERPPFEDGSRCHPHRLVPEKGYVEGNVVPRCPECHAEEPGSSQYTRHARQGGLNRAAVLTPKQLRAIGQKGARACHAQSTAEQRRARARKAARAIWAR